MRFFALVALLACALTAAAQSKARYEGPRPPKPDQPFLLHATRLLDVETGEAAQRSEKDATVYTVQGATSPTRTPMAEPIFLFESDKIDPNRLSLYRMTVNKGVRELGIPLPGKRVKNAPKPVFLMVNRIEGKLYRVEANEYLENGEYCLSPDGSNKVFCFTTY